MKQVGSKIMLEHCAVRNVRYISSNLMPFLWVLDDCTITIMAAGYMTYIPTVRKIIIE